MSKNKIRVISALLIGIMIVCIMAACGQIQDEPSQSGSQEQQSGSQDVTVPATDSPDVTEPPAGTEPVADTQPPATAEEATTTEPQTEEPITTTEPADSEEQVSQSTDSASQSTGSNVYEKIVSAATEQIGVPFTLGGSSPEDGFDTSGLTYYCVNAAGVDFPRSLKDQLGSGQEIPYSELQAGDLVYFAAEEGGEASFCGVYVGGGLMIYAPVPDDFVKTANITTNYWTTHFVTGIRVSASYAQ